MHSFYAILKFTEKSCRRWKLDTCGCCRMPTYVESGSIANIIGADGAEMTQAVKDVDKGWRRLRHTDGPATKRSMTQF